MSDDPLFDVPTQGPRGGRLRPGIRIGPYRLEHRLGTGGMGVVWRAIDERKDGERVALKFLPDVLASDEVALEHLRREARLMWTLHHPGIVQLRDLVMVDDLLFLVMECLDGPSLRGVLAERLKQDRSLSPDEARWLLEQVAPALDHAHQQGIIHRDIKPANLMLTKAPGDKLGERGESVKVADFGVAYEVTASVTHLTGGGQQIGTLPYMAPEVLDGDPPRAAADIYALGATLFELVHGDPPFRHGVIAEQIRSRPPADLSSGDDALDEAVAAALGKMPEARPGSVSELLAVARGESTGAPTWGEEVEEPPALRRGLIAAGVLTVALTAAAFGLAPMWLPLLAERGGVDDAGDRRAAAHVDADPAVKVELRPEAGALAAARLLETRPSWDDAVASFGELEQRIRSADLWEDLVRSETRLGDGGRQELLESAEWQRIRKALGRTLEVWPVPVLTLIEPAPSDEAIFVDEAMVEIRGRVDQPRETSVWLSVDGETRDVALAADGAFATPVEVESGQVRFVELAAKGLDPIAWTLAFDAKRPTIEIMSPVPGDITRANRVVVAGRVVDDIGLDSVRLAYDGQSVDVKVDEADGAFAVSWPLRGTGPLEARLEAEDHVSNVTVQTVRVNRDLATPKLVRSDPDAGAVVIAGSSRLLHLEFDEPLSQIHCADAILSLASDGRIATGTLRAPNDATPEWKLSWLATDLAGNQDTETLDLRIAEPDPFADAPSLRARFSAVGDELVEDGDRNLPVLIQHEKTGIELVYVSSGVFELGSPTGEVGRGEDEGPTLRLPIAGFYVGRTETSQRAWQRGGGARLGEGDPGDPVVRCSWREAREWARANGLGLPTEAQWEYAASGARNRVYPWGDRWKNGVCQGGRQASCETRPARIGSFPGGASWCGALDMAGNVWEWCADEAPINLSEVFPRGSLPGLNGNVVPASANSSAPRMVARGGSWAVSEAGCRTAARWQVPYGQASEQIGFRVMVKP